MLQRQLIQFLGLAFSKTTGHRYLLMVAMTG